MLKNLIKYNTREDIFKPRLCYIHFYSNEPNDQVLIECNTEFGDPVFLVRKISHKIRCSGFIIGIYCSCCFSRGSGLYNSCLFFILISLICSTAVQATEYLASAWATLWNTEPENMSEVFVITKWVSGRRILMEKRYKCQENAIIYLAHILCV